MSFYLSEVSHRQSLGFYCGAIHADCAEEKLASGQLFNRWIRWNLRSNWLYHITSRIREINNIFNRYDR